MKFQKIVAPTITELFERQMQGVILSGQVTPGEKLPTEAELAESMNISKSAVHAGIKNLERMGFVRIVPRHGIYVCDWAEFGNVDTLISGCTNADILALRSIINDFRAEAQVKPRADVDKLAELACSFHRYICVKSGNNVIPLIVNGFHDVNMALWTLWIRQVGPRAAGDVLDELLYYITTGNSDGAVGFYGENANEFLSKI